MKFRIFATIAVAATVASCARDRAATAQLQNPASTTNAPAHHAEVQQAQSDQAISPYIVQIIAPARSVRADQVGSAAQTVYLAPVAGIDRCEGPVPLPKICAASLKDDVVQGNESAPFSSEQRITAALGRTGDRTAMEAARRLADGSADLGAIDVQGVAQTASSVAIGSRSGSRLKSDSGLELLANDVAGQIIGLPPQ